MSATQSTKKTQNQQTQSNPSADSQSHSHARSNNPNNNLSSTNPFDINGFGQFYINQLNHLSEISQSFFADTHKKIDPIETNMKIWQESINYFSHFMMPTIAGNSSANNTDKSSANSADNSQPLKENNTATGFSNKTPPLDDSQTNAHNPFTNNDLLENTLDEVSHLAQRLFNETVKRLTTKNNTSQSLIFDIIESWHKFTTASVENSPVSLLEQQTQLWQKQCQLYQNTLQRIAGTSTEPVITPAKGDKRFNDEDWTNIPLFDYLKQSYLLTADTLMDSINKAEGMDDKTRQRLSFFTRQWLNAIAPSNFLWSNPEVMRLTIETGGKNLIDGLKQLAEDFEKSAEMLNIRMTDKSAFELGKNIATTEGKVVFRNRMFELIQYTPTTDKVKKRPLLIVPPWINKFYILDLKEKNSYIKWALNEGHSIFVISWVNPDSSYKDVGMETYMHEGLLTALDEVQKITGEPDANVIGYCIGGMLLSLTLAWLTEKNQSERIASATFWATMFDFKDPGDLGVFIDERIVDAIEQEGAQKGVFDGRLMGVAFSLLRENSLYWNYYIQNYLKGERPTPFDLLYWNSDATNVTAALHRFALRELYIGNKMIKPNTLEFDDIKVDLSQVKTPIYIVATLQDHIVKWKSSYAATQVFGGDVTFVLGESGHVAGIINPPTGKYGFYTYDDNLADPDEWFENAQKQDRSWWLHWAQWADKYSNGEVESRQPGVNYKGKPVPMLGDAPGDYVRVKAEDVLNKSFI